MSTVQTADVIDTILGVEPGSAVAALRSQKPEYIANDQNYYLSIFEPDAESAAAFPALDRALIAVRVASHTGSTSVVCWYADLASSLGATQTQIDAVKDVSSTFADTSAFGAAVRRADRVTLEPDTTEPQHIEQLKAAGLSPAAILSLSQTIAFVNYQLRLIAGLRAFGVSA